MPSRSSLNVSLTPELTAYVAAQVALRCYRSAFEVRRARLRLLQRGGPVAAMPQPSSMRERTDGIGFPDRAGS